MLLAPLQFAINTMTDQFFFILVASKDKQKCIHIFNRRANTFWSEWDE